MYRARAGALDPTFVAVRQGRHVQLLFLRSFFFSSRRRHTRSKRDWSSDVCSSDLGGFILPNARVDVLLSRRQKNATSGKDVITSEIILQNVRVLAIDQAPREKDGQNSDRKSVVQGKSVELCSSVVTQTNTLAGYRV